MNHLLDVLMDPGDGILISAPYYLGFDAMCTPLLFRPHFSLADNI
jgi:hypothetical protein